MEPFETDHGSLRLMEDLTPAGRAMRDGFLRICHSMHPTSPTERMKWDAIHFRRPDIISMTMERKASTKRTIVTTVHFANGTRWRNGALSIPGLQLPQTLMETISGRMLDDVVQGTPIKGLHIVKAVQDLGIKGITLRIISNAGGREAIPYVAPATKAPTPSPIGW